MKKLVRDHNPDEGAPELISMDAIDANHAVHVDPDRYSIEEDRPIVPSLSLEQRIERIENRLGPETPEEIEHRNRRNREAAERAAEAREAKKAERQPDPVKDDVA